MFLSLSFPQFSAQVIAARDHSYAHRVFIVVRQDPDSHKTFALACSNEAVGQKIYPGMPVHVIRKRHPDIEILLRDKSVEQLVIQELKTVADRYTPEFFVDDESGEGLLNLTGTPILRETSPDMTARIIQNDILSTTGMARALVGASRSVVISRILARQSRGSGIGICQAGDEEAFLAKCETKYLPGISPLCREKLKKFGLKRVDQLQKIGREGLRNHFGDEGEKLYCLSHGMDVSYTDKQTKSVEVETIFEHDINDFTVLRERVWYTIDKLCNELKKEGVLTNRMTILIRYGDNKTVQRTIRLGTITNDFLTIRDAFAKAFFDLYQRRVAIKLLQLSVKKFESETGQLDLLETTWERKQKALSGKILEVRERMSFDAVLAGVNV
jgi:DNA polymerase-4